jgi:hypothetical protein
VRDIAGWRGIGYPKPCTGARRDGDESHAT